MRVNKCLEAEDRMPASSSGSVSAHEISKRFGLARVLRQLSVSFSPGEIALLLGANGAGKSTLLRTLAGLCRPDSGHVSGIEPRSVGFFSHHLSMYSRLTVWENLDLFRRIAAIGASSLDDVIREWDLGDFQSKQLLELSKGTQARVSLARVFMSKPTSVFLDEPTSNLDTRGVEMLTRALLSDTADRCVVIATHDIHRLRGIATRVVVLRGGAIAADTGTDGTPRVISDAIDSYLESNR